MAKGQELLSATEGPCPAMEFEYSRFWCGLVRHPGRYPETPAFGDRMIAELTSQALGIGTGCDSEPIMGTAEIAYAAHAPDRGPPV